MKPYVAQTVVDFRDAACRTQDTNIWFEPEHQQQAKIICNSCPIIDTCYAYALTLPVDTEGIYAGRTQHELHKPRRAANNPKPINHGTHAGYNQHRRYGIPQCQPCLDAAAKYKKERKTKLQNRPRLVKERNITHGTNSGAIQHGQYGIPICEPCRQARNQYMREYNQRRKNRKLNGN